MGLSLTSVVENMEEVLLGIDEDFGMPLEQEEEVLEQEMVDGVIPADALAALDDAENVRLIIYFIFIFILMLTISLLCPQASRL